MESRLKPASTRRNIPASKSNWLVPAPASSRASLNTGRLSLAEPFGKKLALGLAVGIGLAVEPGLAGSPGSNGFVQPASSSALAASKAIDLVVAFILTRLA